MIDASVAQAAGGAEATASEAMRSRDFLISVLEVCHHLVYTPPIEAEWHAHRSRFALKWQSQMYARKKVDRLDDSPSAAITAAIAGLDEDSSADREILEKDALLVTAALGSDGIVISRDERARTAFERLAVGSPALGRIRWVNPDRDVHGWTAAPRTWGRALGPPKRSGPARD